MSLTKSALATGARSFLRSRTVRLVGVVGALYIVWGFFFVCRPWEKTPAQSLWLVCTTATVGTAAAPLFVLLIAFMVREILRKP